jgi:predicted TPR repeat methyltransferase
MGEALRGRAERLTGVDLSPAMIARARASGHYDGLEVAEATDFLMRMTPGAFDLIVAADTLPYFGDLEPILTACRHALADAGLLAFSIETFDGEGYRLQRTMRFAHARAYIEDTAAAAGLRPVLVRPEWVRREGCVEAPGLICVVARAAR